MADLGLSSPGALYYVEPGIPADEEERGWRQLEDSGGEGLDSEDDITRPEADFWPDAARWRPHPDGGSTFRWLGG